MKLPFNITFGRPLLLGGVGISIAALALILISHNSVHASGGTSTSDVPDPRDAEVAADLYHLHDAVSAFYRDNSAFPSHLTDLSAASPSTLATPAQGIDGYNHSRAIDAARFHGPYLDPVPVDPKTGTEYSYSTAPGTVGEVTEPGSK